MAEHARALAQEQDRSGVAVSAAQEEAEQALATESQAHQKELEGKDIQLRTVSQELEKARQLGTEAMSAEQMRTKEAESRATVAATSATRSAKELSDRLIAEARGRTQEEIDRSKAAITAASKVSSRELEQQKMLTQQQTEATTKARSLLLAASKSEQIAKLGQTSALATITKKEEEIRRVTDLLTTREAKMRTENAAKIADLAALAAQAKDKEVAHAIVQEQAKMRQADLNYKSRIQQKDDEIARHLHNHRRNNNTTSR